MKTIKIFTNLVLYGWSPLQYETGIGGSEEKLIEFARYLAAKGNDVTIYMNGQHGEFDNVKYRPHKDFTPWEEHDLFISFKNAGIFSNTINAKYKMHWTTEVEPKWPDFMLSQVDKIVTISEFHKSRMGSQDKVSTEYLWFDMERMNKNKVNKKKGTVLFSSSFDRGLEELLENWKKLQVNLQVKELWITYGWEFLDNVIKDNPNMILWKLRMEELLKQDGIKMVGRVPYDEMCKIYWQAEYWTLPLNKAESELFCINAVKAQYAGCKPIVRRLGALNETVNHFIPWKAAINNTYTEMSVKDVKDNQRFATDFNLDTRLKEWTDKILMNC